MTLRDDISYVSEIRSRILKIVASLLILSIFFFSFGIKDNLPYPTVENSIVVNTFKYLKQDLLPASATLVVNPAGAALLQMQISLFLALIAGFPIILYHLLKIVLPAYERRTFFSALIYLSVLFMLGAAFSYFAVVPLIMKFLYAYALLGTFTFIHIMGFISIAMGFTIIPGVLFAASMMMLFMKYEVLQRLLNNWKYALPVFVVIGTMGFAVAQQASGVYTDVIKNRAGTLTYNVPNASGTLTIMPNFTRFTANGTWTKPSGVTVVIMEVVSGGGGGGGGITSTDAGSGGGGGGGALAWGVYNGADLPATLNITVGAAGTGGAAGAAGTSGGNTNVSGANLTLMAYGGGGGGVGSTASNFGAGGGGGGTGGAGSQGGNQGDSTGGLPTIQGASQGNRLGGGGSGGGNLVETGNAEYGGSAGSQGNGAVGNSLYGAGGGGGGGRGSGAAGRPGGKHGSYSGDAGNGGAQGGGAGGAGTNRTYGAGDGGGGGGSGGGIGGVGGVPGGGGGGGGAGSGGGAAGSNGGRGEVRIWAW